MIRTHEFNSAWWGSETGIVDSPAFFDLEAAKRDALLSRYAWVEFHATAPEAQLVRHMQRAGFVFGDAQLQFRMPLRRFVSQAPSSELELQSAGDTPFSVEAAHVRVFEGERFFLLPDTNTERVAQRYALWARRLIEKSPSTCLRAARNGVTQGWFLSAPTDKGLDLTLAMLSREATISGSLLYGEAMSAYARAGHAIGVASYSYRHTAVANMYASLGARLTGVRETWLWVRD